MPNITVGINKWVVARRMAASQAEGTPLFFSFVEKRKMRERNEAVPTHSPISAARLITSGLSGCMAVGLISNGHFGLAHVSSACDTDNWNTYKQGLDAFQNAVGELSGCVLGYSDEVDKRQPTFKLVEGWLAPRSPRVIDYRNVGGGLKMTPEQAGVRLDKKEDFSATDIEKAVEPNAAALFIAASGNIA